MPGENEDLRDPDDDEEENETQDDNLNGHVDFSGGAAPMPAPKPQRRPRRGRPGGPAPGTGSWAEMPGGKGTRVSGLEVWPDLLEDLKARGKTPYDFAVRVVCEDPPPTRPIGNAFDASAIVGDRSTSPSDRLYQMVRDNYHMTWAKGPAIYDVQFVEKAGGRIARRCSLQMPHPDEVIAMKRAEASIAAGGGVGQPQYGGGAGPAHGVGGGGGMYGQPQYGGGAGPQPGYPSQYAQQWPQPHGFAAPQQSEETAQLRAELQRERENGARMQGQLTEILSALKEGRAPNASPVVAPAPAQSAPPAPAAVDLDGVVLRILDRMGIKPGFGSPAPAAAQPVAQSAQPPIDQVEATVMRVLGALGVKPGMPGVGVGTPPATPRSVVDETDAAVNAFEKMVSSVARLRGFGKKLDKVFSDEAPVEAVAEVVEGAEGKLPFDAVAIPEVKWGDGRPVMYTVDPSTGKIDWTAAAFSNPAVVEKVADGFNKFMGTIGKVVQAAAKAQATGVGEPETEVVDETPSGARDAGGGYNGMG